VNLLLDAHTFLWFATANPRLSTVAAGHLGDPNNQRLLSVATAWEIAIKSSLGKLQLSSTFDVFLAQSLARGRITLLPIEVPHLEMVATLPWHHKDPFDCLLAAQALVNKIAVVSVDTILDAYGVTRLW